MSNNVQDPLIYEHEAISNNVQDPLIYEHEKRNPLHTDVVGCNPGLLFFNVH